MTLDLDALERLAAEMAAYASAGFSLYAEILNGLITETQLRLVASSLPALVAMARRTEQAERERDEARASAADLRGICDHAMRALRLADETSDGYRDLHAAWQRWAARLAPDAIGDEAKREAIEAVLRAIVAHRAALTGLLEHAEQHLADADRPHKVDAARDEVAALCAVLGGIP